MAYRTLELKLISARDLKDVNIMSKMEVYAVVSLSGDPISQQRVAADRTGGRNPAWNATVRLAVPASGAGAVRVLLRTERALGDRDVGEVQIPLSEVLAGAGDGPTNTKFVAYEVRRTSGKTHGILNLSYKLGEVIQPAGHAGGYPAAAYAPPPPAAAYPTRSNPAKTGEPAAAYRPPAAYPPPSNPAKAGEPATAYPAPAAYPPPTNPAKAGEPATAYPAPAAYPPAGNPAKGGEPVTAYPAVGPSMAAPYAAPQPQYGYGYPPPPQAGYGYGYPAQAAPAYGYAQQPVKPPKKNNNFGMGLGAGLLGGALGGMLIGELASDASAYDAGYDAGFDDGGGFDF